jgi:AraC-like DNA-binding protein
LIEHDGDLFGVQLSLTPAGARALLGLPAAELAGLVIALEDVLGGAAPVSSPALPNRPTGRSGSRSSTGCCWHGPGAWGHRSGSLSGPGRPSSGGTARVDDVATAVGWSRRHLPEGFRREYGISPKELARIARSHRSVRLARTGVSLAHVAAACGYSDQSHVDREWNRLAGLPPSRWRRADELWQFGEKGAG